MQLSPTQSIAMIAFRFAVIDGAFAHQFESLSSAPTQLS